MPYPWETAIVDTDAEALKARIGVMFLILFVSLFAVSFPAASKSHRLSFLRIPRIVFFIGKHFGTGVILSTAFVHLLQDAFVSLFDPDVQARWPLSHHAGLIILASLLAIFLVEYISTAYVDRLHSYSSAPSSPAHTHPSSPLSSPPHSPILQPLPNERTPLLPPALQPPQPSQIPRSNGAPPSRSLTVPLHPHSHSGAQAHGAFFDGHHRYEPRGAHAAHHHLGPKRSASGMWVEAQDVAERQAIRGHEDDEDEDGHGEEEGRESLQEEAEEREEEIKVGKRRQVVGILVLQLGIMLHSSVIGLTLAITTGSEFTSLVTAITFHQLFEGLSLGVRIAALPSTLRLLRPVLSVLFAVTTPVGIAVGLGVFVGGTDEARLRFTQGLLSAISAGLLIYASCVEMLAADFVMDAHLWRSGVSRQALALGSVVLGAGAMALVD